MRREKNSTKDGVNTPISPLEDYRSKNRQDTRK